MEGRSVVLTLVFLAAAGSCVLVSGSICLNDSTLLGGGERDGEYAPVLLVGRYKMKVDSTNEQYQKLETLAQEQLKLQRQQLQSSKIQLQSKGYYLDCEDAYEDGVRVSGMYTIQPDDDLPFQVYCDMETDSGGWTVFQRRKDGSVDFYRDWMDYARGFGNLTGEFWLGLRKLNRITRLSSASGNELRVDLVDFERNTAHAKYGSFGIGNSADKYRLSVSGYSGTAGDSLTYHNGYPFTTKDQDNDARSNADCAVLYKGAWWHNSCHHSNLNGLYLRGHHSTFADGVNWNHWKGYYYSVKFTEMKVRRQ